MAKLTTQGWYSNSNNPAIDSYSDFTINDNKVMNIPVKSYNKTGSAIIHLQNANGGYEGDLQISKLTPGQKFNLSKAVENDGYTPVNKNAIVTIPGEPGEDSGDNTGEYNVTIGSADSSSDDTSSNTNNASNTNNNENDNNSNNSSDNDDNSSSTSNSNNTDNFDNTSNDNNSDDNSDNYDNTGYNKNLVPFGKDELSKLGKAKGHSESYYGLIGYELSESNEDVTPAYEAKSAAWWIAKHGLAPLLKDDSYWGSFMHNKNILRMIKQQSLKSAKHHRYHKAQQHKKRHHIRRRINKRKHTKLSKGTKRKIAKSIRYDKRVLANKHAKYFNRLIKQINAKHIKKSTKRALSKKINRKSNRKYLRVYKDLAKNRKVFK